MAPSWRRRHGRACPGHLRRCARSRWRFAIRSQGGATQPEHRGGRIVSLDQAIRVEEDIAALGDDAFFVQLLA